MSSSLVCKQCGCSEIDTDPARGDAVCTQCGSVLEDQLIISEVQFAENSLGGASVVGQFVSSDGPKTGLGVAFHHGMGKESRQITLENGKHKIQRLSAHLKLNQHCIDTAFNFFKMAVSRRLTRGRKTDHVIAACVYIVCRTEGTPHMLLDFSDILQIDVYTLGRTYLQLSKELCINIPALDPCLYVPRFAHKLEFEDKTHDVSMTALRLVQRMKRDWMAQGRRPSGLCGAALLVGARVHDFSRTIKDIIRVVKIGEGTIRKRLAEFEATPSSQLTIDEFQKIDLEEEMDPPCFTENKRKAKMQQLEEGQLSTLTDEVSDLQMEIDKVIEEARDKRTHHRRKSKGSKDDGTVEHSETEGSEIMSPRSGAGSAMMSPSSAVGSVMMSPRSVVDCGQSAVGESPSREMNEILLKDMLKDVVSDEALDRVICKTEGDLNNSDIVSLVKTDMNKFHDEKDSTFRENVQSPSCVTMCDENTASGSIERPSVASLGIKCSIEEYMRDTTDTTQPTDKEVPAEDDELDLTGIDDDELDQFLLSEEEVKVKTKLWMQANSDYLIALKEKQEKERLEREEAEKNPELKKKKRPRKKQVKVEHNTAADAIKMMLQEKKISSKINYDVLKDLNRPAETPVEAPPTLDQSTTLVATEIVPETIRSFETKRFKRPSDPPVKTEPESKKPRFALGAVKEEVVVKDESKPVIVESGPIQYDEEADEDFDEDEDEEEEVHIRAADLMGHGAEEDYHEYGYDDD